MLAMQSIWFGWVEFHNALSLSYRYEDASRRSVCARDVHVHHTVERNWTGTLIYYFLFSHLFSCCCFSSPSSSSSCVMPGWIKRILYTLRFRSRFVHTHIHTSPWILSHLNWHATALQPNRIGVETQNVHVSNFIHFSAAMRFVRRIRTNENIFRMGRMKMNETTTTTITTTAKQRKRKIWWRFVTYSVHLYWRFGSSLGVCVFVVWQLRSQFTCERGRAKNMVEWR